jgi:two-component system, NtrC family, sensor histidine kinase HydH
MEEELLGELRRYVGWSESDERALRALHAAASPHFPRIAVVFYDAIFSHGEAQQWMTDDNLVRHLKVTLQQWLDQLLSGPWDDKYYESRCRVGRHHVRAALPQHYLIGAMNVVRRELEAVIEGAFQGEHELLGRARAATSRVLDLDLAIMLHTYREDLLAQQARSERLSTFGQLVGSISHDLRNPLATIETSVLILRGRVGEDERAKRQLDRIDDQLRIANGIINDLLDMMREKPLTKKRVLLQEVVDAAAAAVPRPEGVTYTCDGVAGLAVDGDPSQLRQVFVNLLTNAVEAVHPLGEVHVRGAAGDGEIAIVVEDSGPGVHASVARRLFEPLVTTKEKGVGLGLALVKRIVERHGGSVGCEARSGRGARFVVRLRA